MSNCSRATLGTTLFCAAAADAVDTTASAEIRRGASTGGCFITLRKTPEHNPPASCQLAAPQQKNKRGYEQF